VVSVSERPTFNVAQLLRDPVGSTRSAQVAVDLETLVPELGPAQQDGQSPEGVLRGPIRLMHITDGVLVEGDFSAEVSLPCSRCLEPVTVTLEISLEEDFVPTVDVITGQAIRPEEEDMALWIDEHHLLDLTEVLRQDVLLAVPVHVLCRERPEPERGVMRLHGRARSALGGADRLAEKPGR
jgi:uncharacterized protein